MTPRFGLTSLLAIFLTLPGAYAQSEVGGASLNGTVTDASGAAVAGAKVMVANKDTGLSRTALSNEAGLYSFVRLPVGRYQLDAEKQGFRPVKVDELPLGVGAQATLDLKLEVGTTTTAVNVTSELPIVETTRSSTATSVNEKAVRDLPINGRNFLDFTLLTPGVARDPRGGDLSFGGQRGTANSLLIDGGDSNNLFFGQSSGRAGVRNPYTFSQDAVQEFQVNTSSYAAEVGRAGGGVINVVTKSGTNALHGTGFWFFRDRVMNANTFFNNNAGVATPKLNRNIFGGTLGGAIVKNRLFIFGNAEGRRDSYEQSVLRTVPSNTLRQGITTYVNRLSQTVQVSPQELTSRLNYAPGVNQAALDLFKQYPVPNDNTAGDGLNTSGHRFNAPLKNSFNTYILKLDYVVNAKNTVFGRGQLQKDTENGAPQMPGQAPAFRNLDNSKGLAFGWNSTISNSLISTTRYGFTRQAVATAGQGTYAAVTFRTIDSFLSLDRPFVRASPTHNLTQDFTYLKGAHTFQFGGSYRDYVNDRQSWANSYFAVMGNSSWMTSSGAILSAPFDTGSDAERISAGSRTAYNDAVVAVLGLITQVTSRYNYLPQNGQVTALAPGAPNPRRFRGQESEMYFQDAWKIKRNLTFTAGVRYLYWPAIYETNNVQTSTNVRLSDWFDRRVANANAGLGAQTGIDPISFQLASAQGGRPLYDNLKNWSPRAALAYSPEADSGLGKLIFGGKGKSVIRAGWGLYYDVFGPGLIRLFDASALGLSTSLNNSSGRLALADAPRFTGLLNVPQSIVSPPPPAAFPVTQPSNFAITNSLDDRLKAPYTMRWNLSFQREMKGGWQLNVAYVASEARRSLTNEDLATPVNLRDPASGQTWNDATQALIRQLPLDNRRFPTRTVNAADISRVQPMAFWENMFPGLAGGGRSATQVAFANVADFYPDITGVSESFDRFADPSASRLGRYAIYSPQFSYLRALRSVGKSSYHSMQVGARKTFRSGDQMDFNWTWAHSLDLGSTTENNDATRGVLLNPYNRRQSWASSDFDQRHIWNANYVYGLPIGKGRHYLGSIGRAADLVVGGWQLGGLFRATTGLPVGVGHSRTWPTSYNLTGYATTVGTFVDGTNKNGPAPVDPRAGQKPNSGPNIFQDPRAAVQAFGFTLPGEIGNRNSVRGDGVFNLDMNLAKNITMPYKENHRMQLRWEVFNVSNTVRFDPLNINLALSAVSNFGKYQGTLQPSRVMQFSLRYDF